MQASWYTRARSRRPVVLAVVVVLCLVAGGGSAAYAFDRSSAEMLREGIVIGGVDVGGMSVSAAETRLRAEIEAPLHERMHLTGDGISEQVSAWELGLRVDVREAVRRELDLQRDGSIVRRLWRTVVGGSAREVALVPELDRARLQGFADQTADDVAIEPITPSLEVTDDGWLEISGGRVGRELDPDTATNVLEEAVRTGATEVDLPVREVSPEILADAYDQAILVRTGENTLHVYTHGKITRSYQIASGQPGYRTPVGTFEIVRKRKDPTWINPGSEWARSLPKRIGPGPDNPLGTRALNLNVGAIRIHGSADASSIGRDASHGCIRMHLNEAEELFVHVDVGTPVVVVDTRQI